MADIEEHEAGGMSRRTLIKRSAVVGGTVLWAAPVVQSFTSPAFGQVGTPAGKDLSYIAFFYQCPGEPPKGIKIEFNEDLTFSCAGDASPIRTPSCGNSADGNDLVYAGAVAGDCAEFDIAVLDGGATVVITFKDTLTLCEFLAEAAVGKCGNPTNPSSGGACVAPIVGVNSLTFSMCLAAP